MTEFLTRSAGFTAETDQWSIWPQYHKPTWKTYTLCWKYIRTACAPVEGALPCNYRKGKRKTFSVLYHFLDNDRVFHAKHWQHEWTRQTIHLNSASQTDTENVHSVYTRAACAPLEGSTAALFSRKRKTWTGLVHVFHSQWQSFWCDIPASQLKLANGIAPFSAANRHEKRTQCELHCISRGCAPVRVWGEHAALNRQGKMWIVFRTSLWPRI